MGQATPCCELVASANRSSIDGRATAPNSEMAVALHEKHDPDIGVQESSADLWRSSDGNSVSETSGKAHPDASKTAHKDAPISAVKTFVKALVHGHPATLLCNGEQKQCIMILDKAIRKLAICQGNRASKDNCMHEIHLASVQDIVTQDVTSFAACGSALERTPKSTKQYKADIRWLPFGTQEPDNTIHVMFAAQRERDLFASALSTLCRQVQTLDKVQTPGTQVGSFEEEREPGEIHDSVFHTTPAKFVSFGNASISEVTDVWHSPGMKDFQLNSGQSPLQSVTLRANPNHGTLQKTKDTLQSRPWKPPSIVLVSWRPVSPCYPRISEIRSRKPLISEDCVSLVCEATSGFPLSSLVALPVSHFKADNRARPIDSQGIIPAVSSRGDTQNRSPQEQYRYLAVA